MIAVLGSMTMAAVAVDIQFRRDLGPGRVPPKRLLREAFWEGEGCDGSGGAAARGIVSPLILNVVIHLRRNMMRDCGVREAASALR